MPIIRRLTAELFYPLLVAAFMLKYFGIVGALGASLLVGFSTLGTWFAGADNVRRDVVRASHALGVLYFLVDRWWVAGGMAMLGLCISFLRVPQAERPWVPFARGLVLSGPMVVALAWFLQSGPIRSAVEEGVASPRTGNGSSKTTSRP